MKDTLSYIRQNLQLLMFGMGIVSLCSCRQKDIDIDFQPMEVAVDFDWQDAMDADPDGMTLLFFPADGTSKAWRFDFEGREGGQIEILPGRYHVLTHNNDLPGINFINTDSYENYAARVRMVSDSVAASTGMLYGAHMTDVRIGNGFGYTKKITLLPDSLSTVYNVRLDSVSGSGRIKTATAIIKGVARSVCMQLQRNSRESSSISAPLTISRERNSMLEATATGFGNPDILKPEITLEVIVTTSHGKYSKTFDVTEQVVNSPYPRNVYIYISGLKIPEADPSNPDGNPDVGIGVGVDGWQVIEITYS